MYMVLSTNLYIYIYTLLLYAIHTFSCIFPRPAAAFWVGRKSSSNRSSRKVLCLIVQKVVQKLAENYFLCRNTQEKGVEVSAKDITKIFIVVKIQWKKKVPRPKYNGEGRGGFGKIQYEKMHFG